MYITACILTVLQRCNHQERGHALIHLLLSLVLYDLRTQMMHLRLLLTFAVRSTLQSTPALTASKEPEPDLSRWCSHINLHHFAAGVCMLQA